MWNPTVRTSASPLSIASGSYRFLLVSPLFLFIWFFPFFFVHSPPLYLFLLGSRAAIIWPIPALVSHRYTIPFDQIATPIIVVDARTNDIVSNIRCMRYSKTHRRLAGGDGTIIETGGRTTAIGYYLWTARRPWDGERISWLTGAHSTERSRRRQPSLFSSPKEHHRDTNRAHSRIASLATTDGLWRPPANGKRTDRWDTEAFGHR